MGRRSIQEGHRKILTMKDSTRMLDCFKMGKCRRYALSIIVPSLFMSVFYAIGVAQASQPVQASNPAAATNATQSRKPTLRESYAMFFNYAAHVETVAVADEKLGNDRTFYRQHLQKASGLTTEEYAQVLASAQRFVAADVDVKKQIAELIKINTVSGQESEPLPQPDGYTAQLRSIIAESASALEDEITNLRQVLGQERADVLDAYLQNDYQKGGAIGSAQPAEGGQMTPRKQSETISAEATLEKDKIVSTTPRMQLATTTDNVTIGSSGGYNCSDFYDNYGNLMSICVDSQMSYWGQINSNSTLNWVELWTGDSSSSGQYSSVFETGSLSSNPSANATCIQPGGWGNPKEIVSGSTCSLSRLPGDVSPACIMVCNFIGGNGATYKLTSTVTDYLIGGGSASHTDSSPPSVTIYYPSIDSISPQFSIQPGFSERFTISGSGLISPFQNNPTVTDQNNICTAPLSEYSFNYANNFVRTSLCTISEGAQTGDDTITVNNGFGSGTTYITVAPPTPVITGISVSGSSASNVLQAGPTIQTVTLTGTNFGSAQPTITIAGGGTGVTIGAITTYSQSSVSFLVTIASDTSAGTVQFELYANDGAQSPNAVSPAIAIAAMVPPVPSINFNGADITNATTQVVVGQQIYLSISLADGSDPSTIATSIDWTVPGVTIADFAVSSNHASAQVIPLTQTEQPTIVFFWVSTGGNATASFTVQYTYCVDVNMESCATATASFVVSAPTNATGTGVPTMTATPGPAELFNRTVTTDDGPYTGPVLSFGDSGANPGMLFTANMLFPASTPEEDQIAMFVQLINYDNFRNVTIAGGISSCSGPPVTPALDLSYPAPTTKTMQFQDDPTTGLIDIVEGRRVFSATTFLMWPPPSTPCDSSLGVSCSVPVPFGSTIWNYGGDAIDTLQVQNTPNIGSSTTNNTPYVLNACSGCTSASPEFVPNSSPGAPNYGYPTWTTISEICDPVPSAE